MEGREINSGITKIEDASESCCLVSRVENPSRQSGGPAMAATLTISTALPAMELKKRGRPKKYGPDAVTAALSPMPISSSIPLPGDFSSWKHARVRPFQTTKKAYKLECESLGDRLAYLVGVNFMPHVITINAGEDLAMKILSFSHQESRAICVLSASGSISNVTLCQPSSSGGTMTYEGRFEILSLTGSFMQTDNGIVKSRSGGLSVLLAGPDGRVFGGSLAGLLVAASPVQVVLGSFLPGHRQEQKRKRSRVDAASPIVPPIAAPTIGQVTEVGEKDGKADFLSPLPFHLPSNPGPVNPVPENSLSSLGSPSNGEISG